MVAPKFEKIIGAPYHRRSDNAAFCVDQFPARIAEALVGYARVHGLRCHQGAVDPSQCSGTWRYQCARRPVHRSQIEEHRDTHLTIWLFGKLFRSANSFVNAKIVALSLNPFVGSAWCRLSLTSPIVCRAPMKMLFCPRYCWLLGCAR